MEAFNGIAAVTSDKNLRGLRHLHDEVQSHVRSFEALGTNPESYGAMFAPVLLSKLPPDVRLVISRRTGTTSVGVNQLL